MTTLNPEVRLPQIRMSAVLSPIKTAPNQEVVAIVSGWRLALAFYNGSIVAQRRPASQRQD